MSLYSPRSPLSKDTWTRSSCTATAAVTLPNPASVGLHEAVGFRAGGVYHEVGHKLGAWHDVGWWELRLTSPDTTPGELQAFPELSDALDWSAF